MKNILSLAFFLTISSLGLSQTNDWQLYSSVDGVDIFTKLTDCDAKNIPSQKAYLLKVVNKTEKEVLVEWDKAIWYNDDLLTTSSDGENHYSVLVKENSNNEGTCDQPHGPYYIFKDFILYQSETKLTKFELQNIKVDAK
jgi:hypothetical protein